MALPRSRRRSAQARRPVRDEPARFPRRGRGSAISGHLEIAWAETISKQEWEIYRTAIDAIRGAGVEALLGGGFALAAFTGRWRDTKDIDLYIRPADRDRAVEALTRAGFVDYFGHLPYDRKWIYRSTHSDVIVDIIWSMANQRAQVDEQWFARAAAISLRRKKLLVVPREEFLWCKLYILQRDHCDWTDLLNLLYASGSQIDWDHVLHRLDEDVPLLRGLLSLYSWLCPIEVLRLPASLWTRLQLPHPPNPPAQCSHDRIRLLDSRRWFAALVQPGEKLEV